MVDKCCSSCILCIPNEGKMVCAGKYYGKIIKDKELESFVCDEYEVSPDFLTDPEVE